MPKGKPQPHIADFTEPPPIGTTVRYKPPRCQPTWLTLIAVKPYIRTLIIDQPPPCLPAPKSEATGHLIALAAGTIAPAPEKGS